VGLGEGRRNLALTAQVTGPPTLIPPRAEHLRQRGELPDDDLKMFVKLIGAYLRDHKAKQAYV
jgi:hypothetical protein